MKKYAEIYMKDATVIEREEKICLLCFDMKVNRTSDNPTAKLVAPVLHISRVIEKYKDGKEYIGLVWACPKCSNVRFTDLFESFDEVIVYLEQVKADGKLSRRDNLVLELVKDGKYDKLPGYSTSIAGNTTFRKQ